MIRIGKLLGVLVEWAPTVVHAVRVWVSPVERDARKLLEEQERLRAQRERELRARR